MGRMGCYSAVELAFSADSPCQVFDVDIGHVFSARVRLYYAFFQPPRCDAHIAPRFTRGCDPLEVVEVVLRFDHARFLLA